MMPYQTMQQNLHTHSLLSAVAAGLVLAQEGYAEMASGEVVAGLAGVVEVVATSM